MAKKKETNWLYAKGNEILKWEQDKVKMAIRAYITTLVSSIHAAENIEAENRGKRFTKTRVTDSYGGLEGRRTLLLSTVAAATVTDSKTELLQSKYNYYYLLSWLII